MRIILPRTIFGSEIWVTFLRFKAIKNTKPPFSKGLLGYFSKLPSKNVYITIGYNVEQA
jgi:hypothetical protein